MTMYHIIINNNNNRHCSTAKILCINWQKA